MSGDRVWLSGWRPYALLAALGPELEGHPQAILAYRLFDVWLTTVGLAALLGLGLVARLARREFYAFAIPLVCIPILAPLAGTVSNDSLAFLGGAVATLGAWQLTATDRNKWLTVALAGMVVAAWAKFTGLVLAGVMVSAVIVYLTWHKRLCWTRAVPFVLACLLAAAPYFVFFLLYGSPTPETPAQIALVEAYCKEQFLFRTDSTTEPAFNDKLELDLFYLKNLSLFVDCAVLFETIKVVLLRRGAQ